MIVDAPNNFPKLSVFSYKSHIAEYLINLNNKGDVINL